MWGLVLCKGGRATVEWVGMVFVSFTFRFVYTHARINDAHYSDGGKYLETNVHARQKPMRTYGWTGRVSPRVVTQPPPATTLHSTSFPRRESSL